MTEFAHYNLPPALMATLAKMGFATPTPIQAQAIPPALEGKDVLGSAETGSGKTAAFGIPMLTKLMTNPRGAALILAPTRELATQIMTVIKQMMGLYSTLGTALLIGGESMGPQFTQLRNRPRIIVGTPGRINDHLERGTLMLHDAGFLVLDETDRMLDLGFSAQIERIMKFLPKVRQTLMFSATFPDNIMQLSGKYLTTPVRIKIGETSKPSANIEHTVSHVESAGKYEMLLKELHSREGSIIVFVKTKRGAERLAQRLEKQRMSADAIHGDLKQSQRDRVISNFRDKKHRIMVATDIAARGLDIPHIEHVINYDLPQAPEDYIHRIGRTARAGAQGSAISLISPDDAQKWREIQRLLNPGVDTGAQRHSQHAPGREGGNREGDSGNGGGEGRRRNRRWRGRKSGGQSSAGTGAN